MIAKQFPGAAVVEDHQGGGCFSDATSTDESDRSGIFCKTDDLFDELVVRNGLSIAGEGGSPSMLEEKPDIGPHGIGVCWSGGGLGSRHYSFGNVKSGDDAHYLIFTAVSLATL